MTANTIQTRNSAKGLVHLTVAEADPRGRIQTVTTACGRTLSGYVGTGEATCPKCHKAA